MQYTEKQAELLNSHLTSKQIRGCTACGSPHMTLGTIDQMVSFQEGGGIALGGGSTIPMASTICTVCGHVDLWAAVGIGLIKPDGTSA